MMRVVQIAPGPMPTFTASTPASIRSRAPSAVATLPAITWMSQFFLISRTVSMHVLAVAVGGVDDDHVHIRLDQRLDAGEVLHARSPPRRAGGRGLSLQALGNWCSLSMSRIVIRPASRFSWSTSSSFSTFAL